MSLDCALVPGSHSPANQYEGGCDGDEDTVLYLVTDTDTVLHYNFFTDIADHCTLCRIHCSLMEGVKVTRIQTGYSTVLVN